MIPLSALLAREEDWTGYLWLIVFFVLPIGARLLRFLLVRLGLLSPEPEAEEPGAGREDPRERARRLREEQRRAEEEGEDLWRRLARGEASEPPPAPAPAPVRAEAREPNLEREERSPFLALPGQDHGRAAAQEVSLESEEEPLPLSVLGRVTEPSEAPETSLEHAGEPAPLASLSRPAATEPTGARRRFTLARGELRRAVVLAEILGPPVAERYPHP